MEYKRKKHPLTAKKEKTYIVHPCTAFAIPYAAAEAIAPMKVV